MDIDGNCAHCSTCEADPIRSDPGERGFVHSASSCCRPTTGSHLLKVQTVHYKVERTWLLKGRRPPLDKCYNCEITPCMLPPGGRPCRGRSSSYRRCLADCARVIISWLTRNETHPLERRQYFISRKMFLLDRDYRSSSSLTKCTTHIN